MNLKRVFLISVIASLSIAALVGIVIFLLGRFGETELRILLTTLFLGLFSLTALCCATLYERQKAAPISLLGLLASAGALLMTLVVVWGDFEEDGIKIALILGILAFSFAHVSLLLLPTISSNAVQFIRSSTFFFIALVAGMLIYFILTDFRTYDGFFIRLIGVFSILDVLGTIVTPIAMKMTASKQ